MSVSSNQGDVALRLAIICGLLGLSGSAISDEPEGPDLAFLEYLGSWEESDEDWIIFSDQEVEETPTDNRNNETNPAPREDKVAEVDDES